MNSKTTDNPVIPSTDFHNSDDGANINRTPLDMISGVIYKRTGNIKRVSYSPLYPAPDAYEEWQGRGTAVIGWLFSEIAGTAEHILENAKFAYMQDIAYEPRSRSGQHAESGVCVIIYVITGQGQLYHRRHDGSPVISRPLRSGDAVLVKAGELHHVENTHETESLRCIHVGLYTA